MKRKQEGWNIVVAGFWNRMIFTPDWVSPRLFPEPEIETLVSLLPVMPLVYRNREVEVEVSTLRLVFRARVLSGDAALLKAEGMARAVLRDLPETPVQAVGINFGFTEEYPSDLLVSVFNNVDDVQLGPVGWSIGERKLTRRLIQGDDVLNLTMTFDGKAVDFALNFHTDITVRSDASLALKAGRAVTMRDAGLTLLKEVYDLQLENEDNNG